MVPSPLGWWAVGGAARVRGPGAPGTRQFTSSLACYIVCGLAAGDQTPAPARDRTRAPRARSARRGPTRGCQTPTGRPLEANDVLTSSDFRS